jgi:hypothetical protein
MSETERQIDLSKNRFTVFEGSRHVASGNIGEVALAYKRAIIAATAPVLIFDNSTGRSIDLDVRGGDEEAVKRAVDQFESPVPVVDIEPAGRGRPKLGVVSREVTLLPRHWDWLATQRGGASVTLRRLVDEARKSGADQSDRRKAKERAYYFMSAMAGDLANFEEASRALFADDLVRVADLTVSWPEDVRNHLTALASI